MKRIKDRFLEAEAVFRPRSDFKHDFVLEHLANSIDRFQNDLEEKIDIRYHNVISKYRSKVIELEDVARRAKVTSVKSFLSGAFIFGLIGLIIGGIL